MCLELGQQSTMELIPPPPHNLPEWRAPFNEVDVLLCGGASPQKHDERNYPQIARPMEQTRNNLREHQAFY